MNDIAVVVYVETDEAEGRLMPQDTRVRAVVNDDDHVQLMVTTLGGRTLIGVTLIEEPSASQYIHTGWVKKEAVDLKRMCQ